MFFGRRAEVFRVFASLLALHVLHVVELIGKRSEVELKTRKLQSTSLHYISLYSIHFTSLYYTSLESFKFDRKNSLPSIIPSDKSQSAANSELRHHEGNLTDHKAQKSWNIHFNRFTHHWVPENSPTVEFGQRDFVGLPQRGQCVAVNVQMWQVRNEVVSDEKTHQDPVVDDSLQIVLER